VTTKNARVWDAYNQERPEEPNAMACTSYDRPVTYDHNPRWNAMDTAHSVAEDIWRNVLDCESKGFDLTVEMPDGSVWIVPIEVQYEPTLCAVTASRVDPQGGET